MVLPRTNDKRWSAFDRISVIRFTGYRDRISTLDREFERVGLRNVNSRWTVPSPFVERFSYYIPPLGCLTAAKQFGNVDVAIFGMYAELKTCQQLGVRNVLIMEDDVRFLRDLDRLDEALASIPDDFDSVKLSWIPCNRSAEWRRKILARNRVNGNWVSARGISTVDTSAYALSARGIDLFVGHYENGLLPGHTILNCDRYDTPDFIPESFNTYLAVPLVAKQAFIGERMSRVNLNSVYNMFLSDDDPASYGFREDDVSAVRTSAPSVPRDEALTGSFRFSSYDVVPQETTRDRMKSCLRCPMHERKWCPTCAGAARAIVESFGGRRPIMPDEDRKSGVCTAYRAYELALASVDFGSDPVPDACPPSCWRRH